MAAPLMPGEVPVPPLDPLLLEWITSTLAEEKRQRHAVATGLDDVISSCETAIAKLREAVAALLQVQEPGEAVDALFNGPAPLAGAIVVAGDLVTKTFYNFPPPDGGPLQAALRDLGYLIHVSHANAGHLFTAYAANLGVLPGRTWELWDANHQQARVRATEALQRLDDAVRASLAADVALRLCQGEWEEGLPPRERMVAAEMMLQQTISHVDAALARLRAMRNRLVELEQIVINATGQAPPPP